MKFHVDCCLECILSSFFLWLTSLFLRVAAEKAAAEKAAAEKAAAEKAAAEKAAAEKEAAEKEAAEKEAALKKRKNNDKEKEENDKNKHKKRVKYDDTSLMCDETIPRSPQPHGSSESIVSANTDDGSDSFVNMPSATVPQSVAQPIGSGPVASAQALHCSPPATPESSNSGEAPLTTSSSTSNSLPKSNYNITLNVHGGCVHVHLPT